MKIKSKTYYMHTINGRPAFFAGNQICFMMFFGKPKKLAKSLKQIRSEQEITKQFRQSLGGDYREREYSYLMVTI